MTPEQFCYWLQGFAEIHQDQPTGQEWLTIMDHLAQVFRKETTERKRTIGDLRKQWLEQTPDMSRYPIDTKPGDFIC